MFTSDYDLAYTIEELRELTRDSSRNQLVVKSNDLIQHSRFSLSLLEQRIIVFLISKIKPDDTGLDPYFFSFREFCDVCGIGFGGGASYVLIRDTIKRLSDKSIWIDAEWDVDGKHYTGQSLVRWVNDIDVSDSASAFWIKFHARMLPYLFRLRERFTQYQLRNALAMNSTYAVALYELLKSYEYLDRPIDFGLDELKFLLGADDVPSYEIYNNFKQKVLDKAVKEISTYADLDVVYKPLKTGRKVSRIVFAYSRKTASDEQSKMFMNQERRFHPGQTPDQTSIPDV